MHNQALVVRANEHLQSPITHQLEFSKRIILNKGIIPGLLQCATATFYPGDEIKKHIHPTMAEVFYILDGEISLNANDETYRLCRGDTFVIFPSTEHSLTFLCKSELFYFGIESQTFC